MSLPHSISLRFFASLLVVAALWIAATTGLRADGIILPPVAAPEVTMPDQRALLVWRDGTETLVIESRFVGQGEDFAWIVPLPSKPDIKPATAGTLPSLQTVFRPRIIPPASFDVLTASIILGFPLLLLFAFEAPRARIIYSRTIAILLGLAAAFGGFGTIEAVICGRGGALIAIPVLFLAAAAWALWRHPLKLITAWVLCLLILLLGAMAIPAFAKVRANSGPMGGDLTIERQLIGDYEVFTLTGTDAAPITDWLTQHGFALPAAAAPVVAEHVRAGGCFVAAKLHRAASTDSTQAPAPLIFTFKAHRPTYPMKLTGTGIRSTLDLDLYVFGDAVAYIDDLPLRACGRVELPAAHRATPRSRSKTSWIPPEEDLIELSHTALRELCVGTTIGTRLRGTLKPEQLQQDMIIQWSPFKKPLGLAKFTESDARGYGALIALGGLLLGGGILFAWRRPQRPSLRARLWVLAAAITIGAASVLAFSTTAVEYGRNHLGYRSDSRALQFCLELALDGCEPRALSEPEVRQRLELEFAKPASESRKYLRQLPTYGDAPNNFHLRQLEAGGWQAVIVDSFGQEQFLDR